jgi:hypothetical protein
MDRARVGAAIAVLALLLPGCGGSGAQSEPVVTRQLQGGIIRNAESQLRQVLHAKRFHVTEIACESGTGGVAACQLNANDGKRRAGTISMSVSVSGGTAQAVITGTSNEAWNAALQRQSASAGSTAPVTGR